MNLSFEQALVVIAHVMVLLRYFPRLWNTSELAWTEFRRLRQRHWNTPNSFLPLVLSDNALPWALVRTILLTFGLVMLTKNYLFSHRDWPTAVFVFLVPVVLGLEITLRLRRAKYKRQKDRDDESVDGVGAV